MVRKIIITVFISLLCCGFAVAENKNAPAQSLNELIAKAEAGDIQAQTILGARYLFGSGVPEDKSKAAYWLQKSAEQGDANAQNNLGVAYNNGIGIPRNYRKAIYWYRKAAKQGNAKAQYNLGISYAKGQGIQKNKVYAYVLASHAVPSLKDEELDKAKEFLDELEDRMTQKEVARAQSLTVKDVLK